MARKRIKRSGKGGKTKTESRHNYIIEVDVQRVKLPKKSGVQIELKAPAFWKWIKSLPASDCYNESGEFIPETPNARTAYFLKRPDSNLPVKTVTRQLPQDLKGLAKWEVDADYLIRNGYPVFGFMFATNGTRFIVPSPSTHATVKRFRDCLESFVREVYTNYIIDSSYNLKLVFCEESKRVEGIKNV